MDSFSALLLSVDPVVLVTVRKVLSEFDFNVSVVATVLAAEQAMRTARFDLAVYDSDIHGAVQLAGRKASAHVPKMVFAIMPSSDAAEIEGMRVHFIVQKPVSSDLFGRSLRAAFGSMLKERRAAFRHIVQITPSSCLLLANGQEEQMADTTVLDISQNGLCFQASELLTSDSTVRFKFELPETKETVQVTGRVAWARASGRTGMKFTYVHPEEQKVLNQWLFTRTPFGFDFLPGAVSQTR